MQRLYRADGFTGARKILDLVEITYSRRPDAAAKPIKGYLQLLKIFIFTVAVI